MAATAAASGVGAAHRATAPAFRLVDDFQAGYLKFNGREPRTLEELAIARADYEHSRRRAEIKAAAKKMALLDPFLPALAERGIKLSWRTIGTTDHGKTLRIHTETFSLQDDKLLAALLELGFREVERKSYSEKTSHEYVTLKHGRALLVQIDATKKVGPLPVAEGGAQ